MSPISLGTSVSVLIAGVTLGISLLVPSSAQAAIFNFSYTFGPYEPKDIPAGSVLSGVLEGDLQPDGNLVSNISSLSAVFQFPNSGSADFDGLYPPSASNSFITLDGSAINLVGWNSEIGENEFNEFLGFYLQSSKDSPGFASVFFVETFVDETFAPDRWSASLVEDPVEVPETGSIAALAIFSAGCILGSRKHFGSQKAQV